MKTRLIIGMAALTLAMSSCTGSRLAGNANEVDDVYFTKADRKAEDDLAAKDRAEQVALREQQSQSNAAGQDEGNAGTGRYDRGLAEKNAIADEYYDDPAPYSDDDFYYSRQVRRFNSRSWNYYDPYYSYDPYYVIGTPTWNYYNNSPWWYDPYYYNGPSYSWTYGWNTPGYYYYPGQYYWNRPWTNYSGWSFGFGSGFGNGGFGNGGFGGFNDFYGNNYGGYGYGSYANGYNPACGPGYYNGAQPGYYGYGPGVGGGLTGGSRGVTGPRTNPSSINTSDRPGNQPLNPRATRPYQGDYPVQITPTAARPTASPSQNNASFNNNSNAIDRPSYNSTPKNNSSSRPTNVEQPKQNYSRPKVDYNAPSNNSNYNTPKSNPSSRPANNGGGNISKPRNDSYSRPSYEAPSRPTFSAPSSSPSISSPSRGSSGGGISRPSGGGISRPR